jgi:hypothetical protein
MKATDLRIGNLVNYKIVDKLDERKEWFEPCEIDAIDLQVIDSDYQPIPLTEEWLLKFGFNIYHDPETIYYEITFDKIANYKFYLSRKKGFPIFYYRNDFLTTQIHSIHSLQNLYFAITNEELTLIK